MWLLFSVALVFIMQVGFLCLETGSTRSKNNINVAAKNVIDFVLSAALFWLIGFGLMFGESVSGLIGSSHYAFGDGASSNELSFFMFQLMFCGTAATLTSGAAAERMKFSGYIAITFILSLLIYPVIGHWAWGGLLIENNAGWLETLGFVDFAGASVVHSVGGWLSLATILILGPRLGRFSKNEEFPSGSNLPMAASGVFLIWLGWFGFNGGSTLIFNDSVPLILLNTIQSAVWSCLFLTLIQYVHKKYVNVSFSLNGIIAGLVGVTASCHAITPGEAAIIGMISGLVMYAGTCLLERFEIDDALAVVPAHLFTGIWGTIAVAIFGDPDLLGTGLSSAEQLQAQLIGIAVIGLYSFSVGYVLISILNKFFTIRVSNEDERIGLNVTEHHAKTELIDLMSEMTAHQASGDFTAQVREEPFTEVGQIAEKYNQVIAKVRREMSQKDAAIDDFKISEQRKSAILDSSMDSIITIDKKGLIIEFNYAAEKMLGTLKKHIKGVCFVSNFIAESDQGLVNKSLKHGFATGEGLTLNRRTTMKLQRPSGGLFPAEITITSTWLEKTHRTEFTLHIRDVAKEIKLQSRLQFLAYKDPLTGLSNRTHMMKQLEGFISKAKAESQNVALYFLDLDKFKKINDTLGHSAGDKLLQEVAQRLTSICRDSDVIARWGGDEFVYIFMGKLDRKIIEQKAKRILDQLRKPIEVINKQYKIPTSIGVAISHSGQTKASRLIQNADIAMFQAKEKGRDNYQFYTEDMGIKAANTLTFEHEIKKALEGRQFYLVYQPKVHQTIDNIVGVEALIRWKHPEKGEISPASFIPIAEDSHLIIDIDEYVVIEALKELRSMIQQGLDPVPVSVNISGRQLMSGDFVSFITEQLNIHGVAGRYIEIEITERVLIQDIEQCILILHSIKGLGISVSIDDFGTGYSSLNYLKRLPIDILKIDRSFVSECDQVAEDREICSAIVNLATGLKLKTIAEGVETPSQVATLNKLGCHDFQGYLFYRPISANDLRKLIAPGHAADNSGKH